MCVCVCACICVCVRVRVCVCVCARASPCAPMKPCPPPFTLLFYWSPACCPSATHRAGHAVRTPTHALLAHSQRHSKHSCQRRAQSHRWGVRACVHAHVCVCVCVRMGSSAVSLAGLHPDLACLANASVTIDNIYTSKKQETRLHGCQEHVLV